MILAENINIATHGQIGKNYIYWVSEGRQFKRVYKIPADPKTFKQRTQRNKFIVATQMWNALTTEQQKEWDEKVKKTQYIMTGYNYFIREKIKEITQMVKKITRDQVTVVDGINVIAIPEIDLEKTVLIYSAYGYAVPGVPVAREAIRCAFFSDSTHITISVSDTIPAVTVKFCYQIIEYV